MSTKPIILRTNLFILLLIGASVAAAASVTLAAQGRVGSDTAAAAVDHT